MCFFLQSLQQFLKGYRGLFEGGGTVGSVNTEKFSRQYGWLHNTKEIADFKNVTLDEAFELPIREALNILSYLKAKSKLDQDLIKAMR